MSKESRYTTTFNFIEEQIMGMGKEYNFTLEIFNNKIPIYELSESSFYYSRRFSWLNRLMEQLQVIYDDVNDTTKRIIELLYFQDNNFEKVIKELGISRKRLVRQHNLIVDEVIELMGMNIYEKKKYESDYRYIPVNVKRQVFERDEGKCSKCGSDEKLHYHHIKRFSEGGTHSVNNLTLLCVSCHAREHKGERAYKMLKSNIMG